MKKYTFRMLASVLSLAAVVVAAPASWLFVHQEDLPEELLAKK